MQRALVILGAGYTARFLLPQASCRYDTLRLSSRSPDRNLSHLPAGRQLEFDLLRPETWANVPSEADVLWCFPATPHDLVRKFAGTVGGFRRLVVLGSTSAYIVRESGTYPPPWIDETAPIDLTRPRVQGEEALRTGFGATILRVAGIYGPGRNPLDWIKDGRVGPSRKYVNLIHVEDLASVCLTALERGRSGEVYNVSDGTPRTWEEICRTARERWGIESSARTIDREPGKRVETRKIREEFQVKFRHSDLFTALEDPTDE